QTYSIRSHAHIRETLIILSVVTLAFSLSPLFIKRKKKVSLMTPFRVSSANLGRRLFRTVTLVVALTIVIGAFFADILLSKSIENTLEVGAGRLGADLMVVPEKEKKAAQAVLLSGGPTIFYLGKDILGKIREFPEIEKASPQLYVQPFSYKVCCTVESILIIAYDPETDFTVKPWIQYSLRGKQGLYDLVVGKLVKYYPGQQMDLFGRKLNVVASLEPTGLGYFDNSAFIPIDGARRLLRELKKREEAHRIPTRQEILDESFSHLFASDKEKRVSIEEIDPEGISAIFVKAKDDVDIQSLTKKIESRFKGVGVINVREATISVKRHLSSMLNAFMLPIAILLFMGIVILSVVFSMSVTERQREIGLMRAVGARQSDVFRIVILESLLLALIGGVFGILFGGSLVFLFKNQIMAALNLLYIWPSPRVIVTVFGLTLVTSLLVGLCSGLYPAVRASRMEPYHAIRSGER
ncbi:MAG: ABC transporter permease, partial [Nitrospirae bacterium]